jgi:uncharacterized flavoprotein (TIGR03862 family)
MADVDVLVAGGGPAGMRAAEVARAAGASVILCDAQPSFGRKFLVAGRGGLNLTHGEPPENFPSRYGAEQGRWRDLLAEFGPNELRAWAAELGTQTYVGSRGRVFPEAKKAAGLLRAWVQRLRDSGVEFRTGARLCELCAEKGLWHCSFDTGEARIAITAPAVILALGGASWPDTGSDGAWPDLLVTHGVTITPWAPANCGWNVDWPAALLDRADGLPLKNLTVTAGFEAVSGELLITRYGLEGGAIYRIGPLLRAMPQPQVVLDLKPQLTPEAVRERLNAMGSGRQWSKLCKLSPAATALIETLFPEDCGDAELLAQRIKNFPLRLVSPRPIAEAISSAGGIAWSELNADLMLRRMRGVFVAGEMIDWEAPTGGYLLQGCFSTGTRAGSAAARFVMQPSQ